MGLNLKRAPCAVWQPTQSVLALPRACDWMSLCDSPPAFAIFHWFTNGSCVPVWHSPQPFVALVSAWIDASGVLLPVGLLACVSPGPWQLSHWTS